MTVLQMKLIETVNELDVENYELAGKQLHEQYNDKEGNYIIYNGQDSSEFVQWEVYVVT